MSSLVLWSCTTTDEADPFVEKGDDPFEITEGGKADGSGLLSDQDQKRIETAFDNAIAAGEQTVSRLESDIAKLESDALAKQREADWLVQQISSREQDLKDQYNNNLMLCLFFPNPATCILANYLANDSTLNSYKQQLDAARAQQQVIASQIQSYRLKRDFLRGKLQPIRDGKQRLIALLKSGSTVPVPPELASSPMTATAYSRAEMMRKVVTAIGSEISVLVEIRNAAVELVNALDQSLATLRSLEQSVDDLVTQQREAFMDLLFGFLSGDAAATADKWLEDQLAARTKSLLDTLNWPLNEFARHLVEERGGTANPDELRQRILDKLMGGGSSQPPLTFAANTQLSILDNTTARSPITVSDNRTITSLEVYVQIRHTYIGDCVVSLEKDGKTFVLQNRVGAGDDDLVKTFRIADTQGVSLAGKWTLVVSDDVKQDTGTLERWNLIVR